MHTDKAKERQGLIKALGLAVAGATLLAGLVALPVTKASADTDPATGFDTADGFVPGELNPDTVPTLTVTKYLSSGNGAGATGSAIDKPASGVGTPAKGIVFNVKEIKPATGKTVAQIDLHNTDTFTYVDAANYFAGETNGQGVISTWYGNNSAGAPNDTAKAFPKGLHYYIMTENRTASPAFTDGTIDSGRYVSSPDSLFGLPYKTTTPNGNTSGYIYNLHLYPKNVDNSSLSKVVTGTTTPGGDVTSIPVPGDKIAYKVTQKIYNAPAVAGDGLLQIPEIAGAPTPHLRVVDRMSSSLSIDASSIGVKITWPGSATGKPLAQTADYTYSSSTTSPKRINSNHTADDVYPGAASGAEYHTFDFFNDPAAIANLVAPGGDAAGAGVLDVEITYKAVVTALGDNADSGGLANDVRSDNIDNPNGTLPGGHTTVPSGAVVFGKLKKDNGNYAPLPGAIFRLSDPLDSAKYLASNGKFYADNDTTKPSGAVFYQATSSSSGVVAFTALPIMSGSASTDVGKDINWEIVEYKSPAGYKQVSNAFSKVTYPNVVGKTPSEIISDLGTGPILPDKDALNFGVYAPSADPTTPIMYNGKAVPKYMVNFASDDNGGDVPASLPLTGGRGIILLLVVGVAIMGGALYIRSRRNATRA